MDLRVYAPRDYTGYGSMALQILKAMDAEDVNIKFYPSMWSTLGHDHESPDDAKLVDSMVGTEMTDQSVPLLHIGLPQMRKRIGGEKIVQLTLWEVSEIPPSWSAAFNTCDLVLTTTEEAKGAMRRGGVRKPIEVIQLGIDTETFHPFTSDIVFRDDRKVRLRDFTFLSVFEWNIRKGYDILIPAFEQEFAKEKVNLVIKSYSHRNIHSPLVGINRIRKDKYSKIFLIDTVTPQDRMPALYNCADAFALFTRGEGHCMPIWEAESCGLPCSVTNVCGVRNIYPKVEELVPTKLVPLGKNCRMYEWFGEWMEWEEATVEAARQSLRAAYELKIGNYRPQMKQYSWKNTARQIVKKLEGL